MILSRFRRKTVKPGMVGLTVTERELTLAYMLPGADDRPLLQHVETLRLESPVQAAEALKQLVDELGLEGADTTAVVESGSYNLMHVERPSVQDSELRDAVKWRIKDLISYPVDEAVVDVYTIPGLEQHARAANWVYAVVTRVPTIQQLVDLVRASGLNLQNIDIPEFCLRNLVSRDPMAEQSTAILHVTPEESLLVLTRGEVMFITRGFDVGFGDVIRAETAGVDGALSLDGLPPAHEQSILEIQRSLDYFDGHFGQAHVTRLLVLPDDILLEPYLETLQSNTGLKVEPFEIPSVMDVSEGIDPRTLGPAVLAIGAALRSPAEVA